MSFKENSNQSGQIHFAAQRDEKNREVCFISRRRDEI